MTNNKQPEYRMSAAAVVTGDGWIHNSLLLVRDEEQPFSAQRLEEHIAAVHRRLIDHIGGLVERKIAPGRRVERELRFLLDELIEALHRKDDLAAISRK